MGRRSVRAISLFVNRTVAADERLHPHQPFGAAALVVADTLACFRWGARCAARCFADL